MATIAKQNDVAVLLDMGGRNEPISGDLSELVDIVSPNETELKWLIDFQDQE